MQYIIICKDIDLSGGELLLERISKQLSLHNNVRICCKSISSEMRNHFKDTDIEMIEIHDWNNNRKFVEGINTSSEIRILTDRWDCYVRFFNIIPGKTKTILYVVRPMTGIVGVKKNIAGLILKKIARICIKDSIKNKKIIYMDTDCKEKSIDYYSFNEDIVGQMQVINISVDEKNISSDELKIKASFLRKSILTVARADFPFKGYLFGLIKWVVAHKNDSFLLTIVSYGDDIDKIIGTIKGLRKEEQNRIRLLGKTDTGELTRLYKSSNIYVGMGTTVIEAAMCGCISIPVAYDTYDVVAQSFFSDNYMSLVASNKKLNCFDELMNSIVCMNEEERYDLICRERRMAISNYSIIENVNRIEILFKSSDYDISDIKRTIIKLVYKFRG